jgi:hypothetical protein
MNYFFLIIFSNILLTFSETVIKPNLCINCKFFKKDFFLTPNSFGKCYLFPRQDENKDYLVDGTKYINNDYYYCSTSRSIESMCGEKGKQYIKKNITFF